MSDVVDSRLRYAAYPNGDPVLRGDLARIRAFYVSEPIVAEVQEVLYYDPQSPVVMTTDLQHWECDELIELVERSVPLP